MGSLIYENTLTSLLFKVKKTQVEMIRDRGFPIEDEENLLEYNVDDFYQVYSSLAKESNTTIRQQLNSFYQKPDGTHVYVYFPETPEGKKFGKQQLVEFVTLMRSEPTIKNFILITEVPLNAESQAEIGGLPQYHIEIFLYTELIINPSKHYLTPKHVLLTHKEAKDYIDRNKIRTDTLRQISDKDIMARYLGARRGDLIRIHRIMRLEAASDEMVNEQIVHRLVTGAPLLMPSNKTRK